MRCPAVTLTMNSNRYFITQPYVHVFSKCSMVVPILLRCSIAVGGLATLAWASTEAVRPWVLALTSDRLISKNMFEDLFLGGTLLQPLAGVAACGIIKNTDGAF